MISPTGDVDPPPDPIGRSHPCDAGPRATAAARPAPTGDAHPRRPGVTSVAATVTARGAGAADGPPLARTLRRLAAAGADTICVEVDPAGHPPSFDFLRQLAALRAELAVGNVVLCVTRRPDTPATGSGARGEDAVCDTERTEIDADPDTSLLDLFAVHQLLTVGVPTTRRRTLTTIAG